MTTLHKPSRANAIRQRRSPQNGTKPVPNPQNGAHKGRPMASKQTTRTSRQSYSPKSIFLPVEPRPVAPVSHRQTNSGALRQMFGVSSPVKSKGASTNRTLKGHQGRMTKDPHHTGYDFAFSLGHTAVRAPLLNLPNLGARWVSAGLTLLLGLLLYTMVTANTFKVAAIQVIGNQRLASDDVSLRLGLAGQPIFKAVPFQIEKDLRTAFPDLAGVSVQVDLPNHIRVAVIERTPILAWYQDGNTTWIDTNGIAFTPRGDVQGLVQIASSGIPPKPAADPNLPVNDQPFIDSSMVQTILTLAPQVPGEAPMIYDPKYGIGWQDPGGWSVYFGQNSQDIEMKKKIYQTILDTFSQQGIQPTLISVANLDAPFYK